MNVAIVRGKFLNRYEMQFFEPLASEFHLTAFGSLTPYHDTFAFPVVKLPSPMDVPSFPYKMSILNRLCVDAHYLWGLEDRLRGFDIVHTAETYFHYTQQSLNAKKKGYVKKVIATVLENIPFNNEGIAGRKQFKARARKDLDHMIALTSLTRDTLIAEGADPKKISVISHFVDTTRFSPTSTQQARIADASRKEWTIMFSGRLERYKGIFDLVYAAKFLLMDPALADYRVRFVIVGEGSEKERMLAAEKTLGVSPLFTHKTARYEAMPALYEDADIAVLPSRPTRTWIEQYCTALLEVQAMGLPIVTTNTGGIPENVGDAGVVVPPADPWAIAEAVKRYILEPKLRSIYATAARRRATTVHDIHIGAKKLSDLYASLV